MKDKEFTIVDDDMQQKLESEFQNGTMKKTGETYNYEFNDNYVEAEPIDEKENLFIDDNERSGKTR